MGASPFPCILINTRNWPVFNSSHASGYDVVPIMALICTSLMAHDVVHLFLCLRAVCTSSLEKRLFRVLAI